MKPTDHPDTPQAIPTAPQDPVPENTANKAGTSPQDAAGNLDAKLLEGATRIILHANSRNSRTVEFPANEKWAWRTLTGWWQDTQDWTDENSGEVFPATFAWFSAFQGERVEANSKSNAEFFYLRVVVSGEEGKPIDVKVARLALERGALEFDSYADCECALSRKCRLHGGIDV